jgi:hypothetical protein
MMVLQDRNISRCHLHPLTELCYLESFRGFSRPLQSNASVVHKYPNSIFITIRRYLVRAADGVVK